MNQIIFYIFNLFVLIILISIFILYINSSSLIKYHIKYKNLYLTNELELSYKENLILSKNNELLNLKYDLFLDLDGNIAYIDDLNTTLYLNIKNNSLIFDKNKPLYPIFSLIRV